MQLQKMIKIGKPKQLRSLHSFPCDDKESFAELNAVNPKSVNNFKLNLLISSH